MHELSQYLVANGFAPFSKLGVDVTDLILMISVGGALAPVRRYLPEFMAAVGSGKLDPSPVFNLRLPLEGAPEGYAAMDARKAIKVVLEISAP